MTTSRIGSVRGFRALVAALAITGSVGAATIAEAAPAFAQPTFSERAGATPVQYWGDHGGWGHHRHHHHDRGYGHRHHGHGRDHGWGHRHHGGWGHRDHGWGHRHHGHHHHHRGHGHYDY
ncbi:hypothetical protein MKK58_23065 [Methylobacterium sp. J-078]|uniref:hypothetical protein n=1 Tax=Methylobacterium sp. J-078 TaxID=2836657 RepID=UPI001FB8877B|nr:hypothetical protein [Methylobacterium sp. J-078]MCJ2047396.1 hypothetical protein [Methylobacterium sp. J-078]